MSQGRGRPWMKPRSALPGFGLTLGVTLSLLSLVVLIPLAAIVLKAASMSPAQFVTAAFSERALHAYGLTFSTALGPHNMLPWAAGTMECIPALSTILGPRSVL